MEIGPCDLFRVSFGIPLNPRLGCFFEGDSRASGTTSNGSDPPGDPPMKITSSYIYTVHNPSVK